MAKRTLDSGRAAIVSGMVLFCTMAAVAGSGAMEKEIDALMEPFNRPGAPGASVAIFREGAIVLAKGYGLAHIEQKVPADEFTNYRLASVSKQFTAMAILILTERGRLDLDDPLSKFFPAFPEIGSRITVRHLLHHTSGIIDYEDLIPADFAGQVKERDVLALLQTQQGAYFTPGTEYRYSNSGYGLLALIVEEVSGQSYAAFLEANIFHPLGMKDTVAFEEGISNVKRRAYGYRQTEDGFVFNDQSRTSAVLGDGGVYTSVMDYFRWDQALYTDRLVRCSLLEEAFTPATLPDGRSTGYGFGWRIEDRADALRLIYHNGLTCGFNTAVRRVPEKRLTVVILTNRNGKRARLIADQLLDLLLSESAE